MKREIKRVNLYVYADEYKKFKMHLLKNDLGSFASWVREKMAQESKNL